MSEPTPEWGSDVVAALLRRLRIPHIALNPGASYRGLHDSLVNYLGNEDPAMLVCLHEEHAVAMAHGYAKVTGKPMAAIVHSNVGLMHATMAIYNAWCDRVPILLLGATGPVDAQLRRPWIDWIHTSRDQGALVRHYTKWDAQPTSVGEAVNAIVRGHTLAQMTPSGPVYICLDVTLQETMLSEKVVLPDIADAGARPAPLPSPDAVQSAAELLKNSQRPVILAGRVSRVSQEWEDRVQLAENLGARVITDLKAGAAFPTQHPLHGGNAGLRPDTTSAELLHQADVILSLDWIDLAGTLKLAQTKAGPITAKVISATLEDYVINGWSYDHQDLAHVDLPVLTTPQGMVSGLLDQLDRTTSAKPETWGAVVAGFSEPALEGDIDLLKLGTALNQLRREQPLCFVRLPLGWPGEVCHFQAPLDFLGYDGGGGVGSGPGMAIGAALALRDTDRLPVAVLGDGDLLMGSNALWSAAQYDIPLLVIVANNHGYMNDVQHQEAVARQRSRPLANKWVGQRIERANIPQLAESMGFTDSAAVTDARDLNAALETGIEAVLAGGTYLIDVTVASGSRSDVVERG